MPKSASFGCSQDKRGFTLVELLVVISIIAILSVIGITIFSSAQKSARDARRRADVAAIAKALEMYKAINGSYPAGAISCETGWNSLSAILVPTYIQNLPKDPQDTCGGGWTGGKFYKYHSNGSFFQVAASLENTSSTGTGNFTYNCAQGCDPASVDTPAEAHNACSGCIFDKTKGGFGYDSQQ